MMKIISCLLLLVISIGLHAQTDCASVRTGKFVAAESNAITITRDSTTQTEYNAIEGTYIKESVEWTGDCTYVLRFISSDRKGEKKSWKKLQYLQVNITEVNSEGYKYTATSPGLPMAVRGAMIKK